MMFVNPVRQKEVGGHAAARQVKRYPVPVQKAASKQLDPVAELQKENRLVQRSQKGARCGRRWMGATFVLEPSVH